MTLRELEERLDQLENRLCGAPIPPDVKAEIDSFLFSIAAAYQEATQEKVTIRCDFYRFVRPSVN